MTQVKLLVKGDDVISVMSKTIVDANMNSLAFVTQNCGDQFKENDRSWNKYELSEPWRRRIKDDYQISKYAYNHLW